MDSSLGQFGTGATCATTRRHDTTTMMPDRCCFCVCVHVVRGLFVIECARARAFLWVLSLSYGQRLDE